ncbi:MAG TPA: ethanolamine ammonia-lyase subunit EutC, partial [Gemmatimonadales bacterium]|nr:ethanolamine ammonia-lyase subunit EutC [Gemmatimonadales bacterium]
MSDIWSSLRRLTPARIGLGHVGGSLPTTAQLAFQLAHARARDAVHDPLDVPALLQRLARAGLSAVCVRSAAADRTEYLQRPDRGRRLEAESRDRLARLGITTPDACFVIADGLSARAAERHAPAVVAALLPRLVADGWSVAPVVVAEQGRVALGDEIGAVLGARLVAVLLGERPGLSSPDSLGIYL